MTDITPGKEAESHCYFCEILRLYPNSHCKLEKVCKEDELWFIEGFDACWSSHKLKYSVTPHAGGFRIGYEIARKITSYSNIKKKTLEWAKTDCRRLEKVLFSDESHSVIHGKHNRFVRNRKGEQLRPALFNLFNEVVKYP